MSTAAPVGLIIVGSLLVALGAGLTQAGWNWRSEVLERGALVQNLIAACRLNNEMLSAVAAAKPESNTLMVNPTTPITDVTVFSDALASGLITGPRYEVLRKTIRNGYSALTLYNQTAARTFSSTQLTASLAGSASAEMGRLEVLLSGL